MLKVKNSSYYDEEGRLMVTYHAQETETYHKRCTTMHRVHIGVVAIAKKEVFESSVERLRIDWAFRLLKECVHL